MSNPQEINEERLKTEWYQKGYKQGHEDGYAQGWNEAEEARADYSNKHGM